ncbi:MAG: hypothetical protein FWD18_00480 [Micrococcales bacterium]|nr:hypothetical protein [Micrococcales bacterium]
MYDFAPHLAVDPQTLAPLAGAEFRFFPTGTTDTSGPGLPVTDLAGVAITKVVSTAQGVVPAVRQADNPTMLAVSGAYVSPVASVQSLIEHARRAAQDAAASLVAAETAAEAAAQTAAVSGIPSGGATGQALVRSGTAATWGTPAVNATQVAFTPVGAVTATTVQAAVAQAASLGSGGGGAVGDTMTVIARAGVYDTPATLPEGTKVVRFLGPTQPQWATQPSWLSQVVALYTFVPASGIPA